MRKYSLMVIAVGALTGSLGVTAGQPPANAAPCRLTRLASLELQLQSNGRVLVPVTIQGAVAYMYLNLGSPFSSLSKQAVARLALPTTQIDKELDITQDKSRVQQYASVSDLGLGDVHYPDEHLLVNPLSRAPEYESGQVIGILGIDRLWSTDLEIDLAQRKMNLYSPDHCAGAGAYWSAQYQVVPLRRDGLGDFYFPMELDGRKIEAVFGTANALTTLSTDVTRRVYGFDKGSSDIESVKDAAGNVTAQYRAMKLTASGLSLSDERVLLTDPPRSDHCRLEQKGESAVGYTGCLYQYPLQIGTDVLGKLHVYIAMKENLLYYTVNASTHRGDAAP